MSEKNVIANLYRFVNRSFLPLFESIHSKSDFEIFLNNIGWNLSGFVSGCLFRQVVNIVFDFEYCCVEPNGSKLCWGATCQG